MDRAQGSCIGRDRFRHIPAVEALILASQDDLVEFQAAVGLRFGFGEKIAAVGNVAAPVAVDRKDRIVWAFLIKAVLAVGDLFYAPVRLDCMQEVVELGEFCVERPVHRADMEAAVRVSTGVFAGH